MKTFKTFSRYFILKLSIQWWKNHKYYEIFHSSHMHHYFSCDVQAWQQIKELLLWAWCKLLDVALDKDGIDKKLHDISHGSRKKENAHMHPMVWRTLQLNWVFLSSFLLRVILYVVITLEIKILHGELFVKLVSMNYYLIFVVK